MQVVKKKILPEYFWPVKEREKNFEIRADEDNIQAGDIIVLEEWAGEYTGASVRRCVRYVLRDCTEYGLMPGCCIIGF